MLAVETDPAASTFGAAELKTLFNGLAGSPAVAIALSGGSDSTALLHLLLAWGQRRAEPIRLVALTVDHGLRAGSAQEAESVAAACAQLGIEHHTLVWEGAKPATGIQAKARAARYDLMTRWCRDHGISVLATAHTADDQAETVLMRGRRTQSPASLAGIWPERLWGGVLVVRPLLAVRRQELRRFLAMRRVSWIEDPSNENERFERVRVRRALADSSVPDLAQQATRAWAETVALSRRTRTWLAQHARAGMAGDITLSGAALRALSMEERLAVLRAVAMALRGRVTAERAELLLLAQRWGAGLDGRATLNGLMFHGRTDHILVGREPGRMALRWDIVPENGHLVWDERFQVTAPAGTRVGPSQLAPDIERLEDVPFWLHQGLPVVQLPSGASFLGISAKTGNHLELLGIAVRATYVNRLEGLPVA